MVFLLEEALKSANVNVGAPEKELKDQDILLPHTKLPQNLCNSVGFDQGQ